MVCGQEDSLSDHFYCHVCSFVFACMYLIFFMLLSIVQSNPSYIVNTMFFYQIMIKSMVLEMQSGRISLVGLADGCEKS